LLQILKRAIRLRKIEKNNMYFDDFSKRQFVEHLKILLKQENKKSCFPVNFLNVLHQKKQWLFKGVFA